MALHETVILFVELQMFVTDSRLTHDPSNPFLPGDTFLGAGRFEVLHIDAQTLTRITTVAVGTGIVEPETSPSPFDKRRVERLGTRFDIFVAHLHQPVGKIDTARLQRREFDYVALVLQTAVHEAIF